MTGAELHPVPRSEDETLARLLEQHRAYGGTDRLLLDIVLHLTHRLEGIAMATAQELKDGFAAVAQEEQQLSAKIDTLIALANQLVAGLQYPISQDDVDQLKAQADALLAKLKGDEGRIDSAVASDTPPPAPPAPPAAAPAADAPAADGSGSDAPAGDTATS